MLIRSNRRRGTAGAPTVDAALEALIREHADSMYRVAVSVVVDAHMAQDIVQEAVLKAWKALPSWRGEGTQRSWLLSITHNTAVSYLRRVREVATEPAQLPDKRLARGVEETADARSDLVDVLWDLAQLDELSRSMVVLRDLEGLSYAEIAQITNVSVATVKSRLMRARRDLHRTMELRSAS